MKTCPSCSNEFYRRVKDCCPLCHAELIISKGVIRLKEDKLIVDEVMLKLRKHIEHRDKVSLPFTLSETSRERKFAYDLLKRAKTFLAAQSQTIATPKDFLLGLLDYILTIPWWSGHINSLLQLQNRITTLAKEYFLMLKAQFTVEKAEKHRLQIYQQSKVEISYGI